MDWTQTVAHSFYHNNTVAEDRDIKTQENYKKSDQQ